MSEKFEKSGGRTEEKQCIEKPFDSPFVVTKVELRGFAEMMAAMARVAGVYEINPEPQKRVIHFRVCDLKIVDTWSTKIDKNTLKPVKEISGCEITPSRVTRGWSYCLCNNTEDKMRVTFDGGEISPADFYLDPGATIVISVSDDRNGLEWYDYTIRRVDATGLETLCSDIGGPKMGIDDPPVGP